MRIIRLILFVSIVVIMACGNEDSNDRLLYLHYENSSGEKGKTTFLYDEDGVNYKARWELLDGSRYSFNYHTYDDQGNWIGKYREFSDSLTSNQDFVYDSNNNKMSESFSRSDGVKGNADYEYDSSGRLVRADCKALNGWFVGIIEYEYDESGIRTGASLKNDGQTIGSIVYTYNEENDLSKEYWSFSNGFSQTFNLEYEVPPSKPVSYTSSNVFIANTENFRPVKENYDYSNEGGGPSHFQYDENGRLINKIFERADGLKTETTFKYDDKGLLIESSRRHNDGLVTTFKYNFNKDRKLTTRLLERSDGIKGSETYTYSTDGKLRKAIYDNFDYWLNGIILYEYDDKNNISRGSFKGKDG
ncbi:MAG: hypothetical protein GY863_04265, partial [bacterium]|nr:hypothetical protein [bacterium]